MAKKNRRPPEKRTIYAKVLRLKTINPGPVWSFLFFEVAIAVGIVLALLSLVSWWGVLVLPVAIAVMVKLNDIVATATERSIATSPEPEPEPLPGPAEPAGMSAAREHRKAQRDRVREQKRLAREEQKAGRNRGPANDDTTVIPTDPSLYARPQTEHTQIIPVITDPPPNQRTDSDATQQLPVVPDELDDFMSDIRGNRPPPSWDPAGEQPDAPEEAFSGNRRRGRKQR